MPFKMKSAGVWVDNVFLQITYSTKYPLDFSSFIIISQCTDINSVDGGCGDFILYFKE